MFEKIVEKIFGKHICVFDIESKIYYPGFKVKYCRCGQPVKEIDVNK